MGPVDRIIVSQIPPGSIFRIGFVCNSCLWIPFGLLAGIVALVGSSGISFNDVRLTGIPGLIGVILIATVIALIGATLLFLSGLIKTLLDGPPARRETGRSVA